MALSVTSAPWQQVAMPALDLRRYVDALVGSEGVAASGDMAVAQHSTPNMSVDIAAGSALVQGDTVAGQGVYLAYNDGLYNLTGFTAAHATLPRIDRVVVRLRDHFHGDAANDVSFQILTGTPTSGATLANLNGAAAVGNSQLLLANVLVPATATTITTANVGNVAPLLKNAGGATVYRKTTAATVNNSTVETDLLNGEITIGAGVMGTNGLVRCSFIMDALNSTGGAVTFRYKLKLGGTTVFDSGAVSFNIITHTRQPVRFDAVGMNLGSAASQVWQGRFDANFAVNGTAWTTPAASGDYSAGSALLTGHWLNTSAEDTSSSKALVLSVTLGTASASAEAKLYAATVEVI